MAGQLTPPPAGWPSPPEVGLPAALAATHDLLPVHPVTARDQLARALAEAGLAGSAGGLAGLGGGLGLAGLAGGTAGATGGAVLAPGTALRVTPTLSTRTVAVAGQPGTHLKLPLPTSTLGLLNRRSISPGSLADGALVRGILAAARRDDAAPPDPGLLNPGWLMPGWLTRVP